MATEAAIAMSSCSDTRRANGSSHTTRLASRFSSSDSGSMLELPRVAQSSSTTATFACR